MHSMPSFYSDANICPIDNEKIIPGNVNRDKFQEMIIQNLQCFCINKERGCCWQGSVAEVEVRLFNCKKESRECKLIICYLRSN